MYRTRGKEEESGIACNDVCVCVCGGGGGGGQERHY